MYLLSIFFRVNSGESKKVKYDSIQFNSIHWRKREKTSNSRTDQDPQRNQKKEKRNGRKQNRKRKKKKEKGEAETSIKMYNRSLAIFLKFLQARRSKQTEESGIKQN